jgi:DNA repair exonuclease SbcCD ATPase subunit
MQQGLGEIGLATKRWGSMARTQDSQQVAPGHLLLPKVQNITLRNFTLFTLEREVSAEMKGGVFCLAGANGLGKSTFLLALTFGITGIVPDRAFTSVDDYYSDSLEFSSKFFYGRIGEDDSDSAEVSLTLKVGDHTFELTRGMFEPRRLRSLTIRGPEGETICDDASMSPSDRHKRYEAEITSRVGLKSFEQLVFLHHFVLTFDERRHLLFWDRRALEQTLYLAFGIDASQAYQADTLRQKMQKAESWARNFNWQAAELLKTIQSLSRTSTKVNTAAIDKLQQEYDKRIKAVEDAKLAAESTEAELQDANLRLADLSAQQATLESEYSRAFANHVAGKPDITMHPTVVASKRDCRCQL